jgi:hypothetical protein
MLARIEASAACVPRRGRRGWKVGVLVPGNAPPCAPRRGVFLRQRCARIEERHCVRSCVGGTADKTIRWEILLPMMSFGASWEIASWGLGFLQVKHLFLSY